jgi:hypothetical protein
MSEETGVHSIPGANEGTRVARVRLKDLQRPPLDAHQAFIAAYDRLNGLARLARTPAVLVAAVDDGGRVLEAVIVEAGHSLVIGRHTGCGLHLGDDTVSLRQLVAHAEEGAAGAAPVVRLWDLNTEQPFRTEDGQPNVGVIAQGPLYAAVGRYALLFVPTLGPDEPRWSPRAEEAWRALPPREFIDRRGRDPDASRRQHARPRRPDGRDYHTNITRVRALALLGEDADPQDAWAELRLEREGSHSRHLLSLERLEQGVLVGRYERCGIMLAGMGNISRVHLLLVRMGEDVLAIDTASTNGTWRGKAEIETTLLRNPDTLSLGGEVWIHWRRLHAATDDDDL